MGKTSKQAATGTVLAAIFAAACLASGGAPGDAPSIPSPPAVAVSGYASTVIDTPPEFTLCLYGIVILAFACLAWLLWLMLPPRTGSKAAAAAVEPRPLDDGSSVRQLLAWLGGLLGYPRPM